MGLSEDVEEGVEELVQQGCAGRSCAEVGCGRACHPVPADVTHIPLECHRPRAEILEDRPQQCEPLRAEDHVVADERHDE